MNISSETVLNYHQRTKHHLERYAKGPETIDWDDQPDPFRRFSGCEILKLPKPGTELEPLFGDLFNPEKIPPQSLNLVSIGLLLELAFGLSAWKQYGPNRWSLRCNPSSGNLHPTEAYLINPGCDFLKPGVYHYVSHDHSLERRCQFQGNSKNAEILIGLTSIHWREAWKYGERAYRYCQHDIGHALGALRYAAATLGWFVEILADFADEDIAQLLGINREGDFKKDEHEAADVLCRIHPVSRFLSINPDELLVQAQAADWFGKANSLRAYHLYRWPVIDEVCQGATKPRTQEAIWQPNQQQKISSTSKLTATQIIRQRRSAQQFDGKMSPVPLDDFYWMLDALLPTKASPFDSWRWPPKIHLFIFVHRVEGLTPGLYALLRDEQILEQLRKATLENFKWHPITDSLPFYHLHSGDLKQIVKTLSCHQSIACDSAFSLAMVAEFSEGVKNTPWHYRRFFWECGLIGQVLYLTAEAAGLRGTGIGCYFDDSVHDILGFKDNTFQSLYHFTIGKPKEDSRLQTFTAYGHLQASAARREAE